MPQLIIYCDGGCRNNQDPLHREAYGSFALYDKDHVLMGVHTNMYGNMTNNEAEYLALRDALNHVLTMELKDVELIIRTDSQLVEGQLTKGWRVKHLHLLPRLSEIRNRLTAFKSWRIERISGTEMKQILGH